MTRRAPPQLCPRQPRKFLLRYGITAGSFSLCCILNHAVFLKE